jgi:hypothetical protein
MRWVGPSIVLLGLFTSVGAHAAPGVSAARPELPIAVAAFPVERAPAAAPAAPAVATPPPAAVGASWPAPVMPAWAPPSPVLVAPAPPAAAAPAPVTPAPAIATPSAAPVAPTYVAPTAEPVSLDACPVSRSAADFTAVAIGVLLRDAGSLFAALQAIAAPNDTQVIDHAAGVEVRRIAFMRQLEVTREEEDQRAFEEKLSLYLRKRAFLQGLEARQSTPSAR